MKDTSVKMLCGLTQNKCCDVISIKRWIHFWSRSCIVNAIQDLCWFVVIMFLVFPAGPDLVFVFVC